MLRVVPRRAYLHLDSLLVVRQITGYFPQQSCLVLGASGELLDAPGARLQLHVFSATNARAELAARAAALDSATRRPGEGAGTDGLPGGLLVSCLGRGEALYGEPAVETTTLREALGPQLELAGWFAGGEIGPVGRRSFVHTYTSTVALLRDRAAAGE